MRWKKGTERQLDDGNSLMLMTSSTLSVDRKVSSNEQLKQPANSWVLAVVSMERGNCQVIYRDQFRSDSELRADANN